MCGGVGGVDVGGLEQYGKIQETWWCDFTRFSNVVPSMTPK